MFTLRNKHAVVTNDCIQKPNELPQLKQFGNLTVSFHMIYSVN